jgi:hypothetical protein
MFVVAAATIIASTRSSVFTISYCSKQLHFEDVSSFE